MSFLASLAPGYPCPKSESKHGTELFLTLVNTRVHQHQKDQLCILRSTNLAGQCCSAAGPCGRCSKPAKDVPRFSSLRSQEFCQCQVSETAPAASLLPGLSGVSLSWAAPAWLCMSVPLSWSSVPSASPGHTCWALFLGASLCWGFSNKPLSS